MGPSSSSMLLCRRPVELRILMLGLDASGKTSVLYRLKTGELVQTIPSIGFSIETVKLPGSQTSLTLWDIGGRDGGRRMLRHYVNGTHGVLFLIDSTDRERLPQAIEELNRLGEFLGSELLFEAPIAVLCNKCDLQTEATANTLAEVQKLLTDEAEMIQKIPKLSGRPRKCFAVSAATGEGLDDALRWLTSAALKKETQTVSLEETKTVMAEAGQSRWGVLYHAVKSVMMR